MNYPTVRGYGARFHIHIHKVPQSVTIISYHVLEIFKKNLQKDLTAIFLMR